MIVIPAVVLCIAPLAGRLGRHAEVGAHVEQGDVVAYLEHAGTSSPVHAPAAGRVGGVLGRGQAVVPRGQGVVWLSR